MSLLLIFQQELNLELTGTRFIIILPQMCRK
jgi:hypothetical protein